MTPNRRPRPSPPPRIVLAVARDRTAGASATGGFLNLRRVDVTATYPTGETSRPFPFDMVQRAALDAVIIAAHFQRDGVRHVYLRSALRPPLAFRPIPPAHDGGLWELPAGLIDPGESPAEAAARELEEELGFHVAPTALAPLGHPTFPAPGFIAEEHHFFHVTVDPEARKKPSEDGSALEKGALIVTASLDDVIQHCRAGSIVDAKTEVALRRLAEHTP